MRFIGQAPEKSSVISFLVGDIHPYDAGTILDAAGNPWEGVSDDQTMRFTTKAGGPASTATSLRVDWDGSADLSD